LVLTYDNRGGKDNGGRKEGGVGRKPVVWGRQRIKKNQEYKAKDIKTYRSRYPGYQPECSVLRVQRDYGDQVRRIRGTSENVAKGKSLTQPSNFCEILGGDDFLPQRCKLFGRICPARPL